MIDLSEAVPKHKTSDCHWKRFRKSDLKSLKEIFSNARATNVWLKDARFIYLQCTNFYELLRLSVQDSKFSLVSYLPSYTPAQIYPSNMLLA